MSSAENLKSIILEQFESFFGEELEALYLFGSRADLMDRAKSDYDLAYLTKKHVSPKNNWALQNRLAQALKKDVDLLNLSTASTVMQMQVVSKGQLIYTGDLQAIRAFEAKVVSTYLTLNDDRKLIVEDFLHG